MLTIIRGFPDQVLAIEASGEVEDDDYEQVLEPGIADRLTRHDKIRLFYVLGEAFEGYEGEAMWEDAKLGMRTFTSYDRIAVVTDTRWLSRSVKAFGWLMPGHVRTFTLADRRAAEDWIVEGLDNSSAG